MTRSQLIRSGVLHVLIAATLVSCDVPPGAEDRNPPIVYFTTPVTGDHVHETITVGVRARDPKGALKNIVLLVNGSVLATSETDPLSIKWDTRDLPVGGPADLEAVATDASGLQSRAEAHIIIDRGILPADQEAIYSLINDGELEIADELINNVWDLGSRSQPVYIAPITWQEDPFDKYWRFLFYGLRPLADLTWAYYAMNDLRYRDKLIEILTSYLDYDEQRTEIAGWGFDDKHTAAFRAMALVNSYGKLARSHDLSPELATRLQTAALKIGGFLADPNNFEGTYNHGFTEAAALLLIAINFPDSASASSWRTTALDRLDALMDTAVDTDCVEVEKSPFYHFYIMAFANEIAVWAHRFDVPLSDKFVSKAAGMTRYATYIAHPNGQVPLIGASVTFNARRQSRTINEILGKSDPIFEYVRTGGKAGIEPSERNVLFQDSGHSILRSGFGAAGAEFDEQTHIVFNVGPYRTTHSHLDGLNIVYASAGKALLTDSGLFAYEDEPVVEFFRSTPAHNTVVVDGIDQAKGEEKAGATITGPTWAYQSGSHQLYDGVLHRRGVLLLQRDLALVIDTLESDDLHDYAQTWHFLPEATVTADPAGAAAVDASGNKLVILRQALSEGLSVANDRGAINPMQGWYSPVYGKKEENAAVAFHLNGLAATFVTLIASDSLTEPAPTINTTSVGKPFQVTICQPETGIALAVTVDALADTGESVRVESASSCP